MPVGLLAAGSCGSLGPSHLAAAAVDAAAAVAARAALVVVRQQQSLHAKAGTPGFAGRRGGAPLFFRKYQKKSGRQKMTAAATATAAVAAGTYGCGYAPCCCCSLGDEATVSNSLSCMAC